ncbi:hypothetical protein DMB38_13740 [Streptomyces sp. WAC 06738]|nr:hypothetical protein DMB38_13740 [Streptomyces sp. WAC 06738]
MRSHAPDAATPAHRADGAICQTGPRRARPERGMWAVRGRRSCQSGEMGLLRRARPQTSVR